MSLNWQVIDGTVYIDGVPVTVEEAHATAHASATAEADALDAARAAQGAARDALNAVLDLAAAYPYPTPEETAIVDGQAVAALDGFRALADPPADVVALAAAVVSWRTAL